MKVLIANRGEIAVRVIRALRELKLKSVAIYSAADKHSPHVSLADESWCIGEARPADTYLRSDKILTAAKLSKAQAVHPGYGFLSENKNFVRDCEKQGLIFIGPRARAMSKLEDKAKNKEIVASGNVPVIPGSRGNLSSCASARKTARSIGYPILLKASYGGGGRGIYRVRSDKDLERAFNIASSEAVSATSRGELYMEKCLQGARHVEMQVAMDQRGATGSFVERDCTMQRRNQKLLEETPSPFVDDVIRARIKRAAENAVSACDLLGLSTVEFLLMPDKKTFYFMEINKRIQVEHPVTEELLGIDLVKLQIKIALGESLPKILPSDPGSRHSIEVRINAEDPNQGFMPQEGVISSFDMPGGPGIRVDSYVSAGMHVGTNYDSLVAKLIATSANGRHDALVKLKGALEEFNITGIKTTIPFHLSLINDTVFREGRKWLANDFVEKTFL
ncbi:acetyl/propionyl/methylcrotonyl-CoA carboxylase subunit alpha [Elusimicrobiota bacterium]